MLESVQAHHADERAFHAALVEAGLVVETAVTGLLGRSQAFEEIVTAVDQCALREGAADGAEQVRFPPLIPRADLERSGYLSSFPHLAGSVFAFSGGEQEALELGARATKHEDWSEFVAMADLTLAPASCYPVYPWVAAGDPLPAGGRLVDVGGWCFRREPSLDPARLQAFRMHENVRIGAPDEVTAWHRDWIERGTSVLASLGLEVDVVPANDPFFGRGGRMLAKGQRDQGLKLEVVSPISSDRPGAILSVNSHLDHFGMDFGIATEDGAVAHTACIGFGLERVTLALLRRHGLQVSRWPAAVIARLWPDGRQGR